MRLDEPALDRVVAAQALDGRHLPPLRERGEQQAGRDRLAVHERRAGTADADTAGRPDAGQAEVAPQHLEQHLVGASVHFDALTVHGEGDPHAGTSRSPARRSTASSTASALIGRSVTWRPSDASAFPTDGRHGRQRRLAETVDVRAVALEEVMGQRHGHVHERRDLVVGEIRVRDLAVRDVDCLEQRRPETHDHRALVLELRARPVYDPARVDGGVQAQDLDLAGLLVDPHLGCAGALVPVVGGDPLARVGIEPALESPPRRSHDGRSPSGL